MGWYLDGRVTAVVGTHTHVPTNDFRVLPGGTAYITDVGMTGPRGGVIGVDRDIAVRALLTRMPIRFETSKEDPWLMGVLIEASSPRRADAISPLLVQAEGVT
jgi:calcineurin-like phosphoesterase